MHVCDALCVESLTGRSLFSEACRTNKPVPGTIRKPEEVPLVLNNHVCECLSVFLRYVEPAGKPTRLAVEFQATQPAVHYKAWLADNAAAFKDGVAVM